MAENLQYFEIDLPQVCRKKSEIVTHTPELCCRFEHDKVDNQAPPTEDRRIYCYGNYRLIAADLCDISETVSQLEKAGFDTRYVCLLISP